VFALGKCTVREILCFYLRIQIQGKISLRKTGGEMQWNNLSRLEPFPRKTHFLKYRDFSTDLSGNSLKKDAQT